MKMKLYNFIMIVSARNALKKKPRRGYAVFALVNWAFQMRLCVPNVRWRLAWHIALIINAKPRQELALPTPAPPQ
jgi:hypothetical protein